MKNIAGGSYRKLKPGRYAEDVFYGMVVMPLGSHLLRRPFKRAHEAVEYSHRFAERYERLVRGDGRSSASPLRRPDGAHAKEEDHAG